MNSETRSSDERMWAAAAHASMVINLIPVFIGLGTIGAMAIWLFKRKSSKWVANQALQAFIYQAILLFIVLITISIPPFDLILLLAAVVYSLYAAYRCYSGQDFRYAWIGNLVSPSRPRE